MITLDRILKIAEVLKGKELDKFNILFSAFLKKHAHFEPKNDGTTPTLWRRNMDYASWENSPYHGSVSEFIEKFPGGIKDWIEWKNSNKTNRFKKWDISKRTAHTMLLMKFAEEDEPPKESEGLKKATFLINTIIEHLKEQGLSEKYIKEFLEKHIFGEVSPEEQNASDRSSAIDDWIERILDKYESIELKYKMEGDAPVNRDALKEALINSWKEQKNEQSTTPDLDFKSDVSEEEPDTISGGGVDSPNEKAHGELNAEDDNDIREKLADLEHEQWMQWAKSIMKSEDLSDDRKERWEECFKPYDKLSEEMKDFDREWADKVLDIVNKKIESKAHYEPDTLEFVSLTAPKEWMETVEEFVNKRKKKDQSAEDAAYDAVKDTINYWKLLSKKEE